MFFSRLPHPKAETVDSLSSPWLCRTAYWPRHLWYPQAMQLLVQQLVKIPLMPCLLFSGKVHTSGTSQIESSSLEIERQKLQSLVCSSEVISILLKSRKPLTNKVITKKWDKNGTIWSWSTFSFSSFGFPPSRLGSGTWFRHPQSIGCSNISYYRHEMGRTHAGSPIFQGHKKDTTPY